MPVDRRTAERFFDRKLAGARRVEGRNHSGYRIQSSEGTVLLPVLTISRGPSGEDLTDRNAKGLADDLGLSLDGFLEACECRLGVDVVTYCAAIRVVVCCFEQSQLDGITFDTSMIEAVGKAVAAWFKIVPIRKSAKLSMREQKELRRARSRLPKPRSSSSLNTLINIVEKYATARFEV